MKKLLLLSLMCLSLVSFAAQLGAAPQFGRNEKDRVCFYQDIHYQGWEDCYSPGDEVANLRGHKNAVSSIRIFGRARVIVFDDEEFRGTATEFSSDVQDLGLRSLSGSKNWSDRIESFRVSSGFNAPLPGNRNDQRDPPPRAIREGICVYEDSNFRGRSECWQSGEEARDLGRQGWSDRISSIRVFGRATAALYRDIGFRGERLVIDRDIADLGVLQLRGGVNWRHQASSLEVRSDRGGPGRGRGPGGR